MPYKDKAKIIAYKKQWNKKYYMTHKKEEIARTARRKRELRIWFNGYKKELSCSLCGEKHAACLEFHHKDRGSKSFEISSAIENKGLSRKKIIDEMNKCIILCANCHRKLHAK